MVGGGAGDVKPEAIAGEDGASDFEDLGFDFEDWERVRVRMISGKSENLISGKPKKTEGNFGTGKFKGLLRRSNLPP